MKKLIYLLAIASLPASMEAATDLVLTSPDGRNRITFTKPGKEDRKSVV